MVSRAVRSILVAMAGAALLGSAPAAVAMQIDGRYIGSFTRTELTGQQTFGQDTSDFMQHQLDLWTRGTTPGGYDLRLRAFLRYLSEFEPEYEDLFRYRFQGELIAPIWRFEGQFTPWQGITPGADPAKERFAYALFDLHPRQLPRLYADWQHREREVGNLPSDSDDRRVQLSYGNDFMNAYAGVRRIDSEDLFAGGARRESDEFRAGIDGRTVVKTVSLGGGYEALLTDFGSREREVDIDIQRANLDAAWSPHRTVTLGGSAFQRWQNTDDNALPAPVEADETALSGNVTYRPVVPLSFVVGRDYRQTNDFTGRVIADYLRFESMYRDMMWRRIDLLAGFRRVQRLGDSQGEVPTNAVYAMADGPIARGVDGRLELHYQRESDPFRPRNQSRQLVQVRTTPRPSTQFDVTWTRTVFPQFAGIIQEEREWFLLLGYDPMERLNLIGTYRVLDGEGRLPREDRFTTASVSWQPGREVTLTGNWEWRKGEYRGVETTNETIWGVDLSTWLSGEFRTVLSVQRADRESGPTSMFYSVSLQKDF